MSTDDEAELRATRILRVEDSSSRKFPHRWVTIAVGRVCSMCMVTQATGEFVHTDDCTRNRPEQDSAP